MQRQFGAVAVVISPALDPQVPSGRAQFEPAAARGDHRRPHMGRHRASGCRRGGHRTGPVAVCDPRRNGPDSHNRPVARPPVGKARSRVASRVRVGAAPRRTRGVGPAEGGVAQAPRSAVVSPAALVGRQLGEQVEPFAPGPVDDHVDAGPVDREFGLSGTGGPRISGQERQSPRPDDGRAPALIVDEVDVEPGEAAWAVQHSGVWRTVGGAELDQEASELGVRRRRRGGQTSDVFNLQMLSITPAVLATVPGVADRRQSLTPGSGARGLRR